MSNCVYNLLGRHFGSELELDNFLFSTKNYLNLDNISDIVFSLSLLLTSSIELAKQKLKEALLTLLSNGLLGNVVNELKKRKRNGEHLTPEESMLANNFYGINFALGQLQNINDPSKKLTTEFDEKNYAKELFEIWHKPADQRSAKETKAISKLVDMINKITGDPSTVSINNPPDIGVGGVSEQVRNDRSKPVEERYPKSWELFLYIKRYWQSLGSCGTLVHYIAELYWLGNLNKDNVRNSIENNNDFVDIINNIDLEKIITQTFAVMSTLRDKLETVHTVEVNGVKVKPEFYPEFVVTHDITASIKGNNNAKLMGIIDLLVIDGNGVPHIYDYKTSDKDMSMWSLAKEDAFLSQTGAYKEVLRAWGLPTDGTNIGIVPLLMAGFNLDENLRPKFDSLEWQDLDLSNRTNPAGTISYQQNSRKLSPTGDFISSLRQYLSTRDTAQFTPEESLDFINELSYYLKQMFPSYNYLEELNEGIIKNMVKYARRDRNNGKWYLVGSKSYDRQYFDSKEDITEAAIRECHERTKEDNKEDLKSIINNILQAIDLDNPDLLPEPSAALNGQNDPNWFINNFRRYCTPDWEFVKCDPLTAAGIIAIKNKTLGYVEFIGLTTISLTTPIELHKNRKSVLSNFIDDTNSRYRGISPLVSDVGNIELMKTCLAINLIAKKFLGKGDRVGNIRVMNPKLQLGRMPVTKQTLDNFGELCVLLNQFEEDDKKLENNFVNYNINMLTADEKARATVLEMAKHLPGKRYQTICSKYEKTGSELRLTLDELNYIRRELEAGNNNLLKGDIDTSTPDGLMYLTVMLAISELNGAFYTQEMRIGTKAEMLINNPEVMGPNIRELHRVVNNANMKYRNKVNDYTAEWRKRLTKFKKEMGEMNPVGLARRYVLDSDYYLFLNMWDYDQLQGIFKFKDPWDTTNNLKPAERELLKWYLDAQFDLRFRGTKDFNDENRALLRADKNSVYYDVPLVKAETLEKLVNGKTKGMVNWFKRLMEWFTHARERSKELIQNTLDKEDYKYLQQTAKNYQMIDRFEYSENGNRQRLIRDNDEYFFSHSLDRIFYNYATVKLRKEVMDEYLPIMKGVLISIRGLELLDGVKLLGLSTYVADYIQAKVLDQSLVPEDYKVVQYVVLNLKNATTVGTLGFNPKSGLFQVFEGVFKNFSRSVFKPMGDSLFGLKEYMQAMKELIGDTPNHFKVVSMGQLLNEHYAINDLDVNQLADRLREGLNSLTLMGKAMWLTSAPDFLNRMGIFIALMIKDGCYDAHELDKENMTLRYNFKKDKRFKTFNDPNADKNSLLYRKEKALYERMIEQFNEEGYTTIDSVTGYERRLLIGDDLPQAYTNKEARSIKSFADLLYGYYNHEDKMLLNSYLLGSLFTQFRTYWSSLKNRWYLKGNIYNQGHWELMKSRDGQLVYKKIIVDDEGNLRVELVWGDDADPDTMDPAMNWKGHYQEGFLLTWGSLIKTVLVGYEEDKGFKERWKDWINGNGDESIKNTRRTNLGLTLHDLAVWALISWIASLLISALKELKKKDKYKNLSTLEKLDRDFSKTFAYSLSSSVEDLGAFKDLLNPITDWTPPSFKFAKNIYTDTGEWLSGDKDFHKVLSENIGLVRNTENLFFF